VSCCCREGSRSGAPSSLESGCIGTWALLGARTVMVRSGRSGTAWGGAFRAAAKEWRCCRRGRRRRRLPQPSAPRSSVDGMGGDSEWQAAGGSGRPRCLMLAPGAWLRSCCPAIRRCPLVASDGRATQPQGLLVCVACWKGEILGS